MPPISGPSSSSSPSAGATATGRATTAAAGDEPVSLEVQLAQAQDQFDNTNATKTAEKLLKKLGFAPGTVDKNFTENTFNAVRTFQRAAGLDVTGAPDTRTINAMRKAAERKAHGLQAPGQKAAAIEKQERRLQKLGYDLGPGGVDGIYDQQTASAVRAFKRDQGIKGNRVSRGLLGKAGRETLADETRALNHDPRHVRVKKSAARARDDRRVERAAERVHQDGSVGFGKGSTGKSIAIAQRHLRAAGFDPVPKERGKLGAFDERTEGMVKEFQRKAHLPVTGRVDGDTWAQLKKATLEATGPASPAQREGERSSAVKRTEKMLKDLGHKPGNVDGLYTENTQKAVDAFRRKHDLGGVGDGVGPGTLRKIRKAWKAKQKPDLNTVKGCAQFLLKSPNVSFWSGLSTGSDEKNMRRLARGEPALVQTGDPVGDRTIKPNLKMMQALVAMAKRGPYTINALTGGDHSSNSKHYRGLAVDVSPGAPASAIGRFGGHVFDEGDHLHLWWGAGGP